jgi:PAS domain-containing protein
MIQGNNFTEISALRDIEGNIMDIIARARDILGRTASMEELRSSFREINEKQAAYEHKLEAILMLHNRRHEEFQALFRRCKGLIAELESAEDKIQHETFRMLSRCRKDAEAVRVLGVESNKMLSGWMGRNLQALKGLFSRRKEAV